MNEYKNHPLSEILPPLTKREYDALKESIKEHGILEPVVIYENLILNGRAIYQIAKELNIEFKIKIFIPTEKLSAKDYVLSKVQGRQLSVGQLACIAAAVYEMEKVKPWERAKYLTDSKKDKKFVKKDPSQYMRTRDIMMDRFGIGEDSLSRAVRLMKDDKKAFEAVKRGEVTLATAFHDFQRNNPSISRFNCLKGKAIDNIARAILNVESKELIIPNCFDSLEVIQNFMKTMNSYGWILEMRMREGKFYANWYGNGRPSLEKESFLFRNTPEYDLKRAIIVAAKECLDAAAKMKAKAAA
jgi:hypothetical protein